MRTALLLIAHGSRVENANEDLRELARHLEATSSYPIVEPCYLELAEPDIFSGGRRCVEREAERVILLPYFLSAGIHVYRDLSAARQALCEAYGDAEFILAQPIGRHPKMSEIVLDRAREADA